MSARRSVAFHLEPCKAEDDAFLWELNQRCYREVVSAQFGGWDVDDQRARFDLKWRTLAYSFIVVDGARVGALASACSEEALTLLELLILPEHQGRGTGTEVVVGLQEDARARGLPLLLQVLRMNRARALYERLGFQVLETTETHYRMRWEAGTPRPRL